MKFPSKFSDPYFKKFILQLLAVIIACVICYLWIDRPLAMLMVRFNKNGVLANYNLADVLTEFAYCGILIIMAFYAYMRLVHRQSNLLVQTAGGVSLAAAIAFFIKTQLQYIFGRTPVRYYGSKTLFFVKNPSNYGFKFFVVSGVFPSGHMCVFTACLMIIALHYPKLKPYAVAALGLLAFILVFDSYHFLSDVIAGTYLGYIIAKVIYRLET